MQPYHRYRDGIAKPGALIVKLYHSGGETRGYIRRVENEGEEDAIFPGEEMEPLTAFRMAQNKIRGPQDGPIYVELAEDVPWNPDWGQLD